MLVNCLIWIYIFLTTYALGKGLLTALGFCRNASPEKEFGPEDISITGFMAATVYAQIYSLFGGVGLGANIILLVFTIFFFAYLFYKSRKNIKSIKFEKKMIVSVIFIAASTLVFAYCASRGYFHYDSDLYHGQSIHWIEDYGVVKGLGLLNGRTAYNSSSFALQALYSFAFLGGMSYHSCAGFFALMIFFSAIRVVHVFRDKKVLLSDFARLSAIYYIGNICDEISAPASDYFTMMLFLYILIRVTEGVERKAGADYYAIPALLSFFDMTVKLSAAPLCMITLIPVVKLIREKKYARILMYGCIVMVILLPYFIRNYFISGWLLYPSVAIDIFNPEWKITRESAMADSAYIVAFGRGFSNMGAADMPVSEWFPVWYAELGRTWKVMLYTGLMGSCIWLLELIKGLIVRKNRYDGFAEINYTVFSVLVSFGFWFMSSPLVRYGQGYMIALPAFTFGLIIWRLIESGGEKKIFRTAGNLLIICIGLFLAYKAVMLGRYMYKWGYEHYYIQPQDYGYYETYTVEMGEHCIIYVPVYGDRAGYYDFPSVPENFNLPRMADPDAYDFSEGFRY
jgi:hypothetical protein